MFLPKVKKLSPMQATQFLYYSPNRGAHIFYKAIKSAIANAKQTLKVDDDLLQFKLFTVEEGNKLKRYTAGSRGSAKPFKKRYSHIKIILISKTDAVSSVKAKKNDKVVKQEAKAAQLELKKPETKEKKVKAAPKKTVVKKNSDSGKSRAKKTK
jgi:large subunit ribosomal protein L22